MPRDTGIADRLRAAGLKVVEVDGWKTRGSDSFSPRGGCDHHTAGGRTGNAPSLNVCINGRSDLPGPLCHVLVARDNTCYVIAAGRANHAGKGVWRGMSGNSSVYGVERENVGTTAEPWRADQTTTAARVHAALIRGCPTPNPDLVCQHKEWAPGRKTDPHSIDGNTFRGLVRSYLNHQQESFFMALNDDEQRELLELTRQVHAVTAKSGYIEKILRTVQAHQDNPNTGGGAGTIDYVKLRDELADELSQRLTA